VADLLKYLRSFGVLLPHSEQLRGECLMLLPQEGVWGPSKMVPRNLPAER